MDDRLMGALHEVFLGVVEERRPGLVAASAKDYFFLIGRSVPCASIDTVEGLWSMIQQFR
jgi:hypothetical protein